MTLLHQAALVLALKCYNERVSVDTLPLSGALLSLVADAYDSLEGRRISWTLPLQSSVEWAATYGGFNTLVWVLGRLEHSSRAFCGGMKYEWSVLRCAGIGGDVQTMQLAFLHAKEQGQESWSKELGYGAALGGHVKALQWAKDNHFGFDSETTEFAAMNGRLEALRWLCRNGCTLRDGVCREAAAGGHLRVLQWAREQNCPWCTAVCEAAALHGHLDVLRWAVASGCPLNAFEAEAAARRGKHAEVAEWLAARGRGAEAQEKQEAAST